MTNTELLRVHGIMDYDFPAGLQERIFRVMDALRKELDASTPPVSAMEDGWVKVEDGYPTPADGDKDGNVLGWDKFENKCHKCSIIDIAQMKLRFTHWRPLPPPPSK